MTNDQTISVIGSGWVGLVSAAIFANSGFKVYVIDIDEKKIETLKKSLSPFYEEGLGELIKAAVSSKNLIPTTDYESSISASKIVFSCVGTPELPDGSYDMSQVMEAAETSMKYMTNGTIFVQKSTVPLGTGETIEGLFSLSKHQIEYVSNPEFLRESSAIKDTLWFDRIVVGGNEQRAVQTIINLYKSVERESNEIANIAKIAVPSAEPKREYIVTSRISAELIKISANSFLALKISFSNSIAQLAEKSGADIKEVLNAVGADKRIGREFLMAGRGYGGGCFPKDVSGLLAIAKTYGIDIGIIEQAAKVNDSMPAAYIDKAKEALDGTYENKKVCVLGLAFKPDTNDVRESAGIKIANLLSKQGAKVSVYDPEALSDALPELDSSITVANSIPEAVKDSVAVFIATDWDEFKNYDLKDYVNAMDKQTKLLVDCMNAFDVKKVQQSGLTYIGIGRSSFKDKLGGTTQEANQAKLKAT